MWTFDGVGHSVRVIYGVLRSNSTPSESFHADRHDVGIVVLARLARAARHHRGFARIGLEDVHHRAGALLLVAVRRKTDACLRDLAPEPGDVDHLLLLQASQGRDGVVDEGEVGGGAEFGPLADESARAVEHQQVEVALERVDDRVLQITA